MVEDRDGGWVGVEEAVEWREVVEMEWACRVEPFIKVDDMRFGVELAALILVPFPVAGVISPNSLILLISVPNPKA